MFLLTHRRPLWSRQNMSALHHSPHTYDIVVTWLETTIHCLYHLACCVLALSSITNEANPGTTRDNEISVWHTLPPWTELSWTLADGSPECYHGTRTSAMLSLICKTTEYPIPSMWRPICSGQIGSLESRFMTPLHKLDWQLPMRTRGRGVSLIYEYWMVEVKFIWKFTIFSKCLRSTRAYSTYHLFDLSWKLHAPDGFTVSIA